MKYILLILMTVNIYIGLATNTKKEMSVNFKFKPENNLENVFMEMYLEVLMQLDEWDKQYEIVEVNFQDDIILVKEKIDELTEKFNALKKEA